MTPPYYQDELVTLYCGDSLDVLPTIASVDLCVTDPPYIIGAVSAGNIASKSGGWADMMNSALWFTEWYRLVESKMTHSAAMWTFCNWRSLPVVMKSAISSGLPVTSLMVWDKEWIGPGGPQGLRPSYELCALLAKPGFQVPNRGIPDVWRHKTGGNKPHGHPAEKPAALMERIIVASGIKPGQVVLDPFAGSGPVSVAASRLGIRSISIEAEEKWCELIAQRLSQTSLDFGGTP